MDQDACLGNKEGGTLALVPRDRVSGRLASDSEGRWMEPDSYSFSFNQARVGFVFVGDGN